MQKDGPAAWNTFYLSGTNGGSNGVVDRALSQGRALSGILVGTPTWARANVAAGDASAPLNLEKPWHVPTTASDWTGPNANYWGNYAYRMALSYKGRINDWIIWNEVSIPVNTSWTQWRGSMQQYATMLAVSWQAIKTANPAARIVLYGDPYWYDHGAYIHALYALLHRMDPTNRFHGYFDVANLHLYSNPVDMGKTIGWLRSQLALYGWGAKPVWVSETNAQPYDDDFGMHKTHRDFRVSQEAQASFLVDAVAEFMAARVDRLEVYKMTDGSDPNGYGLTTNAGGLRRIVKTYAFMNWLMRGVTGGTATNGAQFDGKGGVFKVVLHGPRERITILWNQSARKQTVHLALGDPQAVSYSKYGQLLPLVKIPGASVLTLKGNDDFTNQYDPRIPVVGGDPAIIVEKV